MKGSPRIEQLAWGTMKAQGLARADDMKLWPGGGRPWDQGAAVGGLFHSTC